MRVDGAFDPSASSSDLHFTVTIDNVSKKEVVHCLVDLFSWTMAESTPPSDPRLPKQASLEGSEASPTLSQDSSKHSARTLKAPRFKNCWTLTSAARGLFLLVLCATAALLGYGTYNRLKKAETDLAVSQFASIADRALHEARDTAVSKRWAIATMAAVVAEQYNNATQWPFVAIPGFERMVNFLLQTTRNNNMGFVPMVWPEQAQEWEDFIYNFYYQTRNWPNDTAVNSFGRGIWKVDKTSNASDFRVPDDGLSTSYGSPNQVLFPVAQVNEGPNGILLFNLHAEPNRGRAIDDMMACAANTSATEPETTCGVITQMLEFVKSQNKGPTSMIFQPILIDEQEADGPVTRKLVGLIPTPMLWDLVLENVFADKVSGIDVVLRNDKGQAFSYTVSNGVAVPLGEGDAHSVNYDRYRHSIAVIEAAAGEDRVFTTNSPSYTLDLYPNESFWEIYSTNNAVAAAVLTAACIVLTSILFFLYDALMRRAFWKKEELLQAKRSFMRFVSHEVRTPLNTVCLGLGLMEDEIAKTILGRNASIEDCRELVEKGADASTPLEPHLQWFALSDEVLRSAQSAVDVLSDLLTYDKVESKTLQLEHSIIPIWQVLEDTVREFRLSARQQNVCLQVCFVDEAASHGLTTSPDEESPVAHSAIIKSARELSQEMKHRQVIGDAARMVQILRNLISNAIKFTPADGVVKVCAEYVPAAATLDNEQFTLAKGKTLEVMSCGSIHVSFQDSGAGMSPDQLSHLFLEGMQFNASKLQAGQGSGFGLAFSKALVELHHGTLVATSEGIGRGSTFLLRLPLYDIPPGKMETTTEIFPSTESESRKEILNHGSEAFTTPSLSVLVVDDAALNRRFLAKLLRNAGHVVEEAVDGQDAFDKVTEKAKHGLRYDTILSDYEMPRLNGPEFVRAIRAAGHDVFVVGVTGNMLAEDTDYFRECGANCVFPKPFRMADLEEVWMENGLINH